MQPFTQHAPTSLVTAVNRVLTSDNSLYAKEHARDTDSLPSVGALVTSVAVPVVPVEWGLGPPKAWLDAPMMSRPKVGHSLLSQAAASILGGAGTALQGPFDNRTWSDGGLVHLMSAI